MSNADSDSTNGCQISRGRIWHVAIHGDDRAFGTVDAPLRSIQCAADHARAGDVIEIHEGIYRERIDPPRGGISAGRRIVFRAGAGEKVEIRGSEVVDGWVHVSVDTWTVTIPNEMFGSFNPFAELIAGDWFYPRGRTPHSGCVYLNGVPRAEADNLESVLTTSDKTRPTWFAEVKESTTTLWAQFPEGQPSDGLVEVNARRCVFYPSRPGINFITVSGLILRHSATNWAPPTAEQVGLIGTHWSRGWIIEDNVVSHSRCCGLTLGKYGDEFDNQSANSAEGYVDTIRRALDTGKWSRQHIGGHIVRRNRISHCGQGGIVGSMGCAFSTVIENNISDINGLEGWFGDEIAGIKFHGAVDCLIAHNRVRRVHGPYPGIWLDWMTQGTRISGNLLYENDRDIYMEVNHGPFIVDNNFFLSRQSIIEQSEGGAYVHNWIGGKVCSQQRDGRHTPVLKSHDTTIVRIDVITGGHSVWANNVFSSPPQDDSDSSDLQAWSWRHGLGDLATFPSMRLMGNLYGQGVSPLPQEDGSMQLDIPIRCKFQTTDDGESVLSFEPLLSSVAKFETTLITSRLLGRVEVAAGARFENPDGSALSVDRDYFQQKRNLNRPTPGPVEATANMAKSIVIWPKLDLAE